MNRRQIWRRRHLGPARLALAAMILAGCASSEMSGDDEARAVAPDDEAGQIAGADDEGDSTADESEPPRRAFADTLSLDEQMRSEVADMGMVQIDGDAGRIRCEPGQGFEISEFEVPAADLRAQTCCDGDDQCLTRLQFGDDEPGDDERHLALVGQRLLPVHFSPDGQRLVVAAHATSHSDNSQAVALASLASLADRAVATDKDLPILAAEELREMASWQVAAADIHALEGLSARALDEGAAECETGHHLPTLLRLAEDAEPLSEHLDLSFERWIGDGDLLLATRGDGPAGSAIVVDDATQCMVRTSPEDAPESVRPSVDVADGLEWHLDQAHQIQAGDQRRQVLRGVLRQRSHPDHLASPPEFAATIDGSEEILLVHRRLSNEEIFWWLGESASPSPSILADNKLAAPAQRIDEGWQREVTLVIDDPSASPEIEIFPR